MGIPPNTFRFFQLESGKYSCLLNIYRKNREQACRWLRKNASTKPSLNVWLYFVSCRFNCLLYLFLFLVNLGCSRIIIGAELDRKKLPRITTESSLKAGVYPAWSCALDATISKQHSKLLLKRLKVNLHFVTLVGFRDTSRSFYTVMMQLRKVAKSSSTKEVIQIEKAL